MELDVKTEAVVVRVTKGLNDNQKVKRDREGMMESILKKVNELEGLLLKALAENEKVASENADEAKANKELRATLNKKASDLKAREEAIKPIEDVASFKAKADGIMRDAKNKLKDAGKAQDLLEKQKAENAKEYADQKAKIARAEKRIVDEKAGIKKGYEQLKKAEAESEGKMVSAFVKKMK